MKQISASVAAMVALYRRKSSKLLCFILAILAVGSWLTHRQETAIEEKEEASIFAAGIRLLRQQRSATEEEKVPSTIAAETRLTEQQQEEATAEEGDASSKCLPEFYNFELK